jgi:hypothetical protein
VSDKVTGVKTNGAITRETMASGKPKGYNLRPRVHSPAGIKARADRRAATFEPRPSTCETRLMKGFNKPGSMNPRKVNR